MDLQFKDTMNKEIRLDFGTFVVLEEGIMESVADEGLDISVEQVDEMIALYREHKIDYVLANRKNSYSFSFAASVKIATSKGVKAVAILKHRPQTPMLDKLLSPRHFKVAIFDDRDEALAWLRAKKAKNND